MNDKLKNLVFYFLAGLAGLLVMLGQYIAVQNAADARAEAAYIRGHLEAKLESQDEKISRLHNQVEVANIRVTNAEAELKARGIHVGGKVQSSD